jgi:hypothetical protein
MFQLNRAATYQCLRDPHFIFLPALRLSNAELHVLQIMCVVSSWGLQQTKLRVRQAQRGPENYSAGSDVPRRFSLSGWDGTSDKRNMVCNKRRFTFDKRNAGHQTADLLPLRRWGRTSPCIRNLSKVTTVHPQERRLLVLPSVSLICH